MKYGNKVVAISLIAGPAFMPLPAFAQANGVPEQLVVTASRLGAVRANLLGSSVTVLEPIELQTRQVVVVSDILRDVPGVAVNRGGPAGQFTQVRIRGAESNHTLALIDGMKASDPFFGEFDFGTLIADDFSRIEVLRGEQSALYGSDAIGGVVNYITASGAEAPGFRARAEGGSFSTFNGSLRAAGVAGDLDYALSGSYLSANAPSDSRFGTRKLGSTNGTLNAKLVYTIAENFRVKGVGRYSALRSDLNDQDFDYPPGPHYGYQVDGNGHFTNVGMSGLVAVEYEGLEGRWKNAVTLQGTDAERKGYGGSFTAADTRSSGDKGQRFKTSYVSSLDFGSAQTAHKITGAFDYEDETIRNTDPTGFADTSKHTITNYGYVGQYDVVIDERIALGAAGRFDQNYRFKDAFTWHVQASYLFDFGLRPHAAAGTGIKAPGIYELYGYTRGPGSYVGNPNLKPEKSEGWEAGFDYPLLGDETNLGITYFHSRLKDEIFTDYLPPNFAASPKNAAGVSPREGVETSFSSRIGREWRIDLAYTYLRSLENGLREVRRAPNIASANIGWRESGDRYGVNLTVRYNGAQRDLNFTLVGPPRVTLPAYTLVNIDADYRVANNWQIYGRVENLFDKKYEDIYTIRSPGIAVYAGVRTSLQ